MLCVQVFNASHMVPYDVPEAAHDMILRFMGVDFSAILEGSAGIPSSVGDDVKPILMDDENLPISPNPPEKTAEETKADWEGERLFVLCDGRWLGLTRDGGSLAYYNAGTAALVVLLIVIALGVCIWCRLRKRRIQLSSKGGDMEENIPLQSTFEGDGDGLDSEFVQRQRKGKARAIEDDEGTPIFDVGEADED